MNTEKVLTWIGIIVIPIALFALTPVWSSLFTDKKIVEYSIYSKREIGGKVFDKQGWPQIGITFDGRKISNGTFLTLSIVNAGRVPIKTDEFESPIVLKSNKPDAILVYRVVSAFPDNLSVDAIISDVGVKIKPLLMNPGDRFSIELFGNDDFNIESVSARIVGVDSIGKMKEEELSGLYINKVQSKGFGTTIERRLLHLSPMVLAISMFFLCAATFVLFQLRWLASSALVRTLTYVLAFSSYITLGIVGAVLTIALKEYELSPLAVWTVVLGLAVSGFFVAMPIRRAIRNTRNS